MTIITFQELESNPINERFAYYDPQLNTKNNNEWTHEEWREFVESNIIELNTISENLTDENITDFSLMLLCVPLMWLTIGLYTNL
jgi:hypothetical protein